MTDISSILTDPVIMSFLKYSLMDDLPNLSASHVLLSHAIPTYPPRSFSEQRNTYALPSDVAFIAMAEETELQV